MIRLFFALEMTGELIATGFDYEKLMLLCRKKGFEKILIHFNSGASLIYAEINLNSRLKLDPRVFLRKQKWGLACWQHGHQIISIKRQFTEGKNDEFFHFCGCCGKIL